MKETLNLLPSQENIGRKKGVFFYAAVGAIGIITVMVGLVANNYLQSKKLDPVLKNLDSQKAGLLETVKSQAQPAPIVTLFTTEKEISDAVRLTPPWDAVINELSQIVPDEVWLSVFDVSGSRGNIQATIKGYSKTQVAVADLIARLESAVYFTDTELVFMQKGDKDATFELKTRLKWI